VDRGRWLQRAARAGFYNRRCRWSPAAPDGAVVDALVLHYHTIPSEFPDWAKFRTAMVADVDYS
jgi:hypothetical protein